MWEKNVKIYDQIVAQCPGIERKGKTNPYTSANGYMFSMINKAGELGIRFSKEVQEKYFEELNTTFFKNHNAVIKGYVLIPEKMLTETDRLAAMVQESHAYVMTLKPK